MAHARNFVSELKDSARVLRQRAGAPDDYDGFLFADIADGLKAILQFNEGFLSGVILIPVSEVETLLTAAQGALL